MEKPIFAELIRKGQLPYDWVQEGHRSYIWARRHFWFIVWIIVMVAIAGAISGVMLKDAGWI